jgi:hypothetical protein
LEFRNASRHPLDRAARSYYRRKKVEMHLSSQTPVLSAVPRWRAWICLCLALFLLYNPYMAAPVSTGGLSFCHPASNRATVGASELQHFSPAGGKDKLFAPAAVRVESFSLLLEVSSERLQFSSQVISPTQQFFGASLWFRPPPAL